MNAAPITSMPNVKVSTFLKPSSPMESSSKFGTQRWLKLLLGVLLVIGCTSCSAIPEGLVERWITPALEFKIQKIEVSDRPGAYTVMGETTLPDKTQITVSAIRYFPAKIKLSTDRSSRQDYIILDRQSSQVRQNKWEARLNLWQTASDGQFQEMWQSAQAGLGIQAEPDPEVVFLASVDPSQKLNRLQAQLDRLDTSRQLALSRFTSDGELYLQTSQSLTLTPPAAPGAAIAKSKPQERVAKVTQLESNASDRSKNSLLLSPSEFLR